MAQLTTGTTSSRQVTSTGIDWLDTLLGGGVPAESVNAILGPTGAGKTTLGAMIAANGTLRQQQIEKLTGQVGRWYYISPAQRVDEIQSLALSYLTGIDRNRLDRLASPSDLSASQPPPRLDASDRPPADQVGSEQDRYYAMQPVIARYLSLLVPSDYLIGRCWTPIEGIATCIREKLVNGESVAGVIVDNVSTIVSTWLSWSRARASVTSTSVLRDFGSYVQMLVARPFSCPVWLVHELTGEASTRRAGARFHHRDASSCKRFAHSLDASIVLGTHDHRSGCFQVQCTKSRLDERRSEPSIVQISRSYATMAPTEDFVLNPRSHRIVPRVDPGRAFFVDADTMTCIRQLTSESVDAKRIHERFSGIDMD